MIRSIHLTISYKYLTNQVPPLSEALYIGKNRLEVGEEDEDGEENESPIKREVN